MVKAFNIADINQGDDDVVFRQKCNSNFSNLLQHLGIAEGAMSDIDYEQIAAIVTPIVVAQTFDNIYPVGSIIGTRTANDSRLSQGTWEQVFQDRYLRGAGPTISSGSQGGSNLVTLTPENIPYSVDDQIIAEGDQDPATVSAVSQDDPEPVTIEPEWEAALWFRRIG